MMKNTDKLIQDAIERAGAALFGELWITKRNKRERQLAKDPGRELPRDPKKAAGIARARSRRLMDEKQSDAVIHWLQHQCGLDMTSPGFDAAKFEAFFKKAFEQSRPVDVDRRTAVSNRLKGGASPGRGGTHTWKEFTRLICRDCKGEYSQKTIERDVRSLRRA